MADQARTTTCAAICPALGAILIGDKVGDFNAREAELVALREAVRHAHSPIPNAREESTTDRDEGSDEQWLMLDGLPCYDRWVRDFKADPPRLPTMGDRYCFGVYRSTHRAASAFMRELVPKYPEARAYGEATAHDYMKDATARYRAMVEVVEPYRDYKAFEAKWLEDAFRRGLTSDFHTLKALHDEAAEALQVLAGTL